MDLISLLDSITDSANNIDIGRKSLASPGREAGGRISFELGISGAMSGFSEAQKSVDCQTLMLAELTFLQQELQFCGTSDKAAQSSLSQAIMDFNDSLNCLKIVNDPSLYKSAAKTHLSSPKECIQGMPNDAVQQSCKSHLTRLQNILKVPGMNPIERAVYDQRIANIATLKAAYLALQQKALS
jgi:hypothetical protein